MSKDIVSVRSLVPPYFQHRIASPFSDRFLIRKLEKEIIRKRSVHLYTRRRTLVDSSSENKQITRTSPTSTIKIYFIKSEHVPLIVRMFVATPRSNSFSPSSESRIRTSIPLLRKAFHKRFADILQTAHIRSAEIFADIHR